MGKLIHSPYLYGPLDVQPGAKNWRMTSGGTAVRKGNQAAITRAVADSLNHLVGRYPRPWFWQAQPILTDTTIQAYDSGSDPLYLTRVYDGVYNARTWTARFIMVPRTSGSGDCYAASYTAAASKTPYRNLTLTALDLCEDIQSDWFYHSRGVRSMTELEPGLTTHNGYTVLDVVYADDPLKTLDTDLHDCVDSDLAKPGLGVLADIAEQIREAFYNVRTQNLPVVLQWHAIRPTGGWATPASTDATAIRITQTDWCNVIDTGETLAVVPHYRYAATSPGVLVPAYLAGRGTTAKTAGQSIKVTFRVLAQAVTQNCQVRFEGPDHVASNYCDLAWAAGAGVSWNGSDASYIYLNTLAQDSNVTSARNKIDIFGKADVAGGELYVYALVGWIIWS